MANLPNGVLTALITPFDDNGNIHWGDLENLVKEQLNANIDGLVVCGTTAETPTLTAAEKTEVFNKIKSWVNGRVPLIMGVGTNSTASTIANAKEAVDLGADGLLVVVPYYNKPTARGMKEHFSKVANAVPQTEIILYDVPGRSAKGLDLDTIEELVNGHGNINSIKDATGSIGRITELQNLLGSDFVIYSGDDPMFLPSIACGANGVISVASNVIPAEMKKINDTFQSGDLPSARDLHNRLYPLFGGLFLESNPIPCKWAAKEMGLISSDQVRSPLARMEEANKIQLKSIMQSTLRNYAH